MRQIEQLVNQQVMRWTEEQRLASRPPPPRADLPRPVICISREFGAQAGELADTVAARFGFNVCDQDLVEQVARQAHVRRRVVESLDERVQMGLQHWVDELIEMNRFRPSDYLRNLSEVVLAIGRHGRSVIIGRGAHVILDPAYALRVRCYAPFAWRSEQVARRHGLSLARAESLTLRVDAERAAFYREHFDTDVSDPLKFDLMLNVSTMPLHTRGAIVSAAFEAKFPEYARAPVSGIRYAIPEEAVEEKVG
ncbi:MAG: AAA family ATPase [Myxococcota bacterium]